MPAQLETELGNHRAATERKAPKSGYKFTLKLLADPDLCLFRQDSKETVKVTAGKNCRSRATALSAGC